MRFTTLIISATVLIATPAQAKLPFLKKAQEAGFVEAKNCQYCHIDKMPKKNAHEGNERGKWLVAQKAAKSAADVDMAWLKNYKGK